MKNIGFIIVIVVLVILAFFLWRRKKKDKQVMPGLNGVLLPFGVPTGVQPKMHTYIYKYGWVGCQNYAGMPYQTPGFHTGIDQTIPVGGEIEIISKTGEIYSGKYAVTHKGQDDGTYANSVVAINKPCTGQPSTGLIKYSFPYVGTGYEKLNPNKINTEIAEKTQIISMLFAAPATAFAAVKAQAKMKKIILKKQIEDRAKAIRKNKFELEKQRQTANNENVTINQRIVKAAIWEVAKYDAGFPYAYDVAYKQ
ncbi:hypothetical protein JYU20_00515 [Bacteroidales bacterium AH-315-I05]|nr:hypothetical protein [Bacteroidales bacterium AH-315-I05]